MRRSFLHGLAVLPSLAAGRALKALIDANTFNRLTLAQQYSAAAYCDHNYEADANKRIRCEEESCPWVERSDARVVVSFTDTEKTDTSGYVAVDHTNKIIVLAVRGSESVRNFETVFNVALEDNNMCEGCQTAAGTWSGWQEIRDTTFGSIRSAAKANPSYSILSTGHSLGGTIAAFAAVELRDEGKHVDIISFGAPRIGNDRMSQYITRQQAAGQGRNYRVTHTGDSVPSLPPQFMGYRHYSPEVVISSGNDELPSRADVEIQDVDIDSDGTGINWDLTATLAAHDFYLGKITKCYDSSLWSPLGLPPNRLVAVNATAAVKV